MTKERLQIEVIRLAEKANHRKPSEAPGVGVFMVKTGELNKFQAGFFLWLSAVKNPPVRQAVKELMEISQGR